MNSHSAVSNIDGKISVTLQVAGLGALEVESLDVTVGHVRQLLSAKMQVAPTSLKVISGGRILKDDEKTLAEYGVTEKSKFLVTKTATSTNSKLHDQEAQLRAEEDKKEERRRQIERIRAAASVMAGRGSNTALDSQDLMLEDQQGHAIKFVSDEDRKALVTALVLHTMGQELMAKTEGDKKALACDP
ncbi:hypothetical protein CYMTET_33536 [Cymbomonas tetramitiformis]|uniref:Ubiquitin-like domain-containing protein n=1 Tax=Cymbomonas tetramitiformis TaxID=36881 RepID=A0AAE0KR29_9CHLO|nr:hypothetical protein CYMTET_33536 [Cymbomonas tetramitiformis]